MKNLNIIKKKYILYISVILSMIICIIAVNINKTNNGINNETNSSVIRVGVYEYDPCYSIKDDDIGGYYHDILNIIDKYDNFTYEYHIDSFYRIMDKVESGELDLVVGVNKTKDRIDNLLFSEEAIGIEIYGLFSNDKNIKFAELYSMEGNSLGIIKGGSNGEHMKRVFKNMDININIIEYENQNKLIEDFIEKKIDLSIQPINEKYNYGKFVYEFSEGPVYIATNKDKAEIINHINKVMDENYEAINKMLKKYYNKYFGYINLENKKYNAYTNYIVSIIIAIIIVVIIYSRKKLKSLYTKLKIKKGIVTGRYTAYYQPIYNPKNDEIVGFEALVRKKLKSGKILPPSEFIEEIEENDMISEIALMILKKVEVDYKKLCKKYNLTSAKYISINVSIDDIIDENFVNKCCNIIKLYDLNEVSICLEIIERFKSDNIKDLNKHIKILKESGFLIAIDDFGMEYSNLDLLDKIDFDIIKLDRYFIYNISKGYIKEEILKFLSSISEITNAKLVIEGVETKEQIDDIKSIHNKNIYVQGYYYSKPESI